MANSGAFRKGDGRPRKPKGALAHTTRATREAFQMLVDRNFDKLEGWIEAVATDNPKDAFGMVMDLASFCVPKLKAIEVSGKDGEAIRVKFVDAKPNDR